MENRRDSPTTQRNAEARKARERVYVNYLRDAQLYQFYPSSACHAETAKLQPDARKFVMSTLTDNMITNYNKTNSGLGLLHVPGGGISD